MICINVRGYHHFGKPPFQLCIRPESVLGGNATIKGHVFAVVEACQGVFVWVADRFSRRRYYSRFHHISEKATPAIKVVADAEKSAEHVKADRDVSPAEFDTPYPQGVQA
jgi:hypothetical protein